MTSTKLRQEPMTHPMTKSVTKTVDINASKDKVTRFLADPMNWPRYAIVNLKAVARGINGRYTMTTKQGTGELEMHAHEALGIIDHTWINSEATWLVPARVVHNGSGSTVMMTFFQPPGFTDEQFAKAMGEMDIEFKKLKEIMEE